MHRTLAQSAQPFRRASRTGLVAADLGNVKGVAVRGLLGWYEGVRGLGSVARMYSTLPPHAQSRLSLDREALGVLPASWIAESSWHALLDAVLADAPCDRERMVGEVAAAIMSTTLRGVHRSLFDRLCTPQLYARYAQVTWRLYHDEGEWRVQLVSDHAAYATLRAWRGHHPLSCDLAMEAGRIVLASMGCRGVVATRRSCVSMGGSQCACSYEWQGA